MENKDYKKILKNIEKQLFRLLLVDMFRLRSQIRKIRQRMIENKPAERMIEKLQLNFEFAKDRREKRNSKRVRIHYPKDLPISSKVEEIKKMVEENQIIIVCGTTGSGKTTQLPKVLLEAGLGRTGRIGCTQPRRLAASGMARRVAKEMYCDYGKEIGCQVRFADNTTDQTIVKFMTDGVILAETMNDKLLLQYDSIIIDEAHERSLNIDFILGYLKNLLPKRPDLKIVISSATLDAESFSEFFDNAPVIQIEGRSFPVEDYFLPAINEEEELSAHISRALQWISELDSDGDVLIFLPGEREIREAADLITGKRYSNTEVLPLFGRLSMQEQQRVFTTGERRRIVLATNVAETSITIPGIHYVIDSGLARLSRYNPRTQVQSLQIEQISQASAKQRRGRCGRVADGVCVYLYENQTLQDAPEFTDPEILRTSLAGVILQMEILNLPSIDKFPFLNPPQASLIREGYNTLIDIGALDKSNELTEEGRDISTFPVDPHLAKMVCEAHEVGVLYEVLVIVSALSIQDPRERPLSNQEAADNAHKKWYDDRSDYVSILNLWNFFEKKKKEGASKTQIKKLYKQNFVNFRRMIEWNNLYKDLSESVKNFKWKIAVINRFCDDETYEKIHKSLLSGFPNNVGMKIEQELFEDKSKTKFEMQNLRAKRKFNPSEYNAYSGTKNKKFHIFPGSNLFKPAPKWIMPFALVETSKLYARTVAEIDPEWIEEVAGHLCRYVYKDIGWEQNRGFVSALETVVFRSLPIHVGRKVHYGRIDEVKSREIFIRDGVVPGNINSWAKWLKIHRNMIADIQYFEEKIRRPHALLDTEAIYNHFNKILPESVLSTRTLEQWLKKTKKRIAMKLEDAIIPQVDDFNLDSYPDELLFFDHPFELKYSFEPTENSDGITLYCPSDELGILPDWATDWLVSGYLEEKIKALVRALPKRLRVSFNPVQQHIDKFMTYVDSGEISKDQHLLVALCDFLEDRSSEKISVDDFDFEKVPNYLVMKVAELDEDGKIIRITEGIPDREQLSSQLSSAVITIQKWIKTGEYEWPGDELPEEISIQDGNSELTGYPALVDESESIGQQVFMNEKEAEANHTKGLTRLFRIQYEDQGISLEKNIPINRNILNTVYHLKPSQKKSYSNTSLSNLDINLALSKPTNSKLKSMDFSYTDREIRKEFVDMAIYRTLTENEMVSIRDSETFDLRAEETLCSLFQTATKMGNELERIIKQRELALNLLGSVQGNSGSKRDIESQLEFLFRPGFLNCSIVWSRYFRYMKALTTRLERLKYSPQKDAGKMEDLIPYQERLDERFELIEDIDKAYGLMDYAWLLQEYRITLFSPEMGTLEKVSPKRLEKSWDETLNDRLKL